MGSPCIPVGTYCVWLRLHSAYTICPASISVAVNSFGQAGPNKINYFKKHYMRRSDLNVCGCHLTGFSYLVITHHY